MGKRWVARIGLRVMFGSMVMVVGTCGGAPEPAPRSLPPRDLDLTAVQMVPAVMAVKPEPKPEPPKPEPPKPPPPTRISPPTPKMTVFGEGFASFEIKDEERVFETARADKDRDIGYLASRTRVVVKTLGDKNGDCRWMELEPRGWICARGKPTPLPPSSETAPALWVPGYDGRIYKDEADVRAKGGHIPASPPQILRTRDSVVKIDGKAYYHTLDGELAPAWAVPRYWGDQITGVSLEGVKETLPVAWTWNYSGYTKPTKIFAEPSRSSRVVRQVELRTRVTIVAEQGRWMKIGEGEWIERLDLRIARPSQPPPEVTGPDEVWIDVSLNEQTLVLYRGKHPVHATLVSTGKQDFNTPPGTFRIRKKTTVTEFKSPRPDLAEYHIKDVAWALHFTKVHAIHGAWWHKGFGANVSMGCVNLPSYDMRQVYEAVEPKMVPGWWSTKATADHPGSIVRIRY